MGPARLGGDCIMRYNMDVLRQRTLASSTARRPVVGIVTECLHAFGRAILRGATRYANLQRRWLLYHDIDRVLDEHSTWPRLDGGIFAGVPWAVIEYGHSRCRHTVYCSGAGDPDFCPVVAADDRAIGVKAAEHLLDCRLEHFAFYGGPQFAVTENRLAGFRQTVEARGFGCARCPVAPMSGQERTGHALRPQVIDWLRQQPRPLGVLAFDDTYALDLAEACLEANIGVPDHVAIVGVNNDDLLCETAWPPLSSVDADYVRVGFTAATVLDRLLGGEKLQADQRHTLLPPIGVVQRQSTSTLAIGEPDLVEAIRYIREHACNPCTVRDVLKVVPVGRRWLERQFEKHLGRSPYEEIVRVRIEVAQRLLRKSDLTLFEIADRCGFAELRSFYRAFAQAAQTTPAAYRRSTILGMK